MPRYVDKSPRSPSPDPRSVTGPIVALIPAYNEQRFIGSLVLAVRSYVDEVVVVDDGSNDRTVEIARGAGARVVEHGFNQGKAAGVNSGFFAVRPLQPAAVVLLDGDGQHRAEDIPTLLAPILSGAADVVVGSRFLNVKNRIPTVRKVGQHGLTLLTNVASGVHVTDSQSGFRAFSGAAVEALSFRQAGFSVESEMQFRVGELQLRVVEVPINVIYAEKAKRNPLRHGMQVVNGVMRVASESRPLSSLGSLGVAALLGAFLLQLEVEIFSDGNMLLRVARESLTEILFVVGTMLLFAAIVRHSVRGIMVEMQRTILERLGGRADCEVNVLVSQEIVAPNGARQELAMGGLTGGVAEVEPPQLP